MTPDPLPQNSSRLNQASLEWLRQTGEYPDPYYPYSFQLINWGFSQQIDLPVEPAYWYSLQSAAARLLDPFHPEDADQVLASNPEIPDPPEQQLETLISAIEDAPDQREAAKLLMEQFMERQHNRNPGLYQDPRSSPPGWDHPNEPDD